MVTAALLMVANIWKQSKCPSTDEWIKKLWCVCIQTKEHYSTINKKEWNFAWCNSMDGLEGYYTEWKKNTVWYHLDVQSKKYNKLVNIRKHEQTQRYGE